MTITIIENIVDWPDKIPDLCKLLQRHFQAIPEANRHSHRIEISNIGEEDHAISIVFEREETKAELDQRARIKKRAEDAYLATLDKQAAKYGKKLVDA